MAVKKKTVAEETPSKFLSLDELLRKNDKKGLFTHTTGLIGYPTSFMALDYRNGYKMKVYDSNDNVKYTYNNVGIFGGTFNTVIGKTSTAKTTICCQMAVNISNYVAKKYGIYAEIYHIGVEQQGINYTRVKEITGLPMMDIKRRYHITEEFVYIEDILEKLEKICEMKEAHKDVFQVDSGFQDEFGDPIMTYIPTVFIIDSLPSLATRDGEKKGELQTGTYANRLAKAISRFYKQTAPIIRRYNIIVFVINHINKKIEIGGMPTQPQTMYLKMDETLPGGFAPLYYAQNIIKIVSEKKFKVEEAGFDGFLARIELLKSRYNKAGKFTKLVYNQERGFDALYSMYQYLRDETNLVGGRNPYRYIVGYEDVKFDDRDFDAVRDNQELIQAMTNACSVDMEKFLSNNKQKELTPMENMQLIADNLKESYDNDESEFAEK